MSSIKLSLLENSYGFLEEAIAKAILAEKDIQQWKFAIFSLTQTIELSLKEVLRREHPILIYTNIDKPNKTVSLELAINRLLRIAKRDIDEKDIKAIKTASKWRNQIVHFEIETTAKEMKSVFSKLLGYVAHFHNSYLDKNLDKIISSDSWYQALSIIEYGEELYKRAKERFEKEGIDSNFIWACRSCDWDAFVIQDDINTCYVCGVEEEIVECHYCNEFFFEDETEYQENFHKYGSDSISICNGCQRQMIHDDMAYDAYIDSLREY